MDRDGIMVSEAILQPVTALLKKGRKWTWGPEQQTALEEIRRCLTTAPVLG